MPKTIIKAEHLSKYYRLGVINNGTLFRDIQTWLALKRGKADPHSRIDENKYSGTADGFWALKDLNFEIKQGDRVGIIGANGAGKSTLLKILSRITAPTEGKVKVKGRVASLLEVGTGFHGELTGRENIYLNGAILGMKKKEVDRKIDEIINFSGIEKHIDTPVKRYSSGMYVRLAFAVAAYLDSEILIADEVLAVGDAAFQKKALGKMNELSRSEGRTVLFVSHNMAAVKGLCSQGIVLNQGIISYKADIDSCIKQYLGLNSESATACWKGKSGDEHLAILETKILDKSGQVAQILHRGKHYTLEIIYEVYKKRLDYVFCLAFHNASGTLLLESSAVEALADNLDDICSTGVHKLTVSLDSTLFAQGEYLVKYDFAIRSIKNITTDTPTLRFSVENIESATRTIIPRRSNIISPEWQWKFS
ncbi:ABC transporter ATP-binding protein [Treponema lecithinolyticum]|uniref:ABC transporter, ATP-binding protein n=1 Tax=Treponema lecithinolyticum ATCC 700332 TaxID=1321815 RepID=A0ABN0P1L1_TRELE|nr:ABC transporter ATP-binding protein [Treponema lecithinolyticum]ERJ94476.1 ABC transporter, ATP-binding protein [Treponema lecithinolyticum ATCC 700332]